MRPCCRAFSGRPASSALTAAGLLALCHTPLLAHEPVTGAATFNGPIARILLKKCVPCHSPRNLAMPLVTYHDAGQWARAIREEVLERRMPPWPAAPGFFALGNDISLTAREKELIVSWADGGTPRGDNSELPPRRPSLSWPHGEPDLLIGVPAQTIGANEPHHVRRLLVAADLAAEVWIRGLDFRPGDRRVVRSVFVHRAGRGGEPARWLGGWTPWAATAALPDPVAHRLSPGSRLLLEVHYQGVDEAVTDSSTLGLYLTNKRPAREPTEVVVRASCAPSGGRACAVARGEAVVPFDAVAWALKPEIGPAGHSLEVSVREPTERVGVLAWIDGREAFWPTPLVFREPVMLPRGTRVSLLVDYDGASAAARNAALTLSLYPVPTPP